MRRERRLGKRTPLARDVELTELRALLCLRAPASRRALFEPGTPCVTAMHPISPRANRDDGPAGASVKVARRNAHRIHGPTIGVRTRRIATRTGGKCRRIVACRNAGHRRATGLVLARTREPTGRSQRRYVSRAAGADRNLRCGACLRDPVHAQWNGAKTVGRGARRVTCRHVIDVVRSVRRSRRPADDAGARCGVSESAMSGEREQHGVLHTHA